MVQKAKSKTEIVEEIFERFLPDYWKKSGNNEQILNGYCEQYSVFSEEVARVYKQLSLYTSNSIFLDDFGFLFRFPRGLNEKDYNYRGKLKAYYQIFLNSGTNIGIKKAISLLTGLNEEAITVTELKEFKPQLFIANMESSSETWTGVGVSVDTNYFYEGTNSIKLSASGAEEITAELQRDLNLDMNLITDIESIRFWYYFDDANKIDNVRIKFIDDDSNTSERDISIESFPRETGFMVIKKNEFDNFNDIKWNDIKKVQIIINSNDTTNVYFDWMQFGVLSNSLKFDVNVDIDESLDIDMLNSINYVCSISKAAGTYYRKLTFDSYNDYFLLGISEINGKDMV